MTHWLRASLSVLVLLCAAPAARSDDAAWIDTAVPGDSVAVGRIDLHRVLASPLGARLFEDLTRNIDGVNWFLGTAFGFDLDQVDSIWFAVGPAERGFALLQGRYDSEAVATKIGRMWGWRSVPYDGIRQVSAYSNDAGEPQLAAVLRDDLLAMGDEAEMTKMLASWQGKAGSRERVRAGVRIVVDSDAEIAVAALDFDPAAMAATSTLGLVEQASLEGRLDDDLHLDLRTEIVDEQMAAALEQLAEGLLVVLARHPEVRADATYSAALANAKAVRRGRSLTLTTQVPGAVILAVQAQRIGASPDSGGR